MHRKGVLTVTAFVEGVTGLLLLVRPLVPIRLLLGLDRVAPEALPIARIAASALIALTVACWRGRDDRAAQPSLLLGVLFYDLAAAGILTHTGWFMGLTGVLLWPAVVMHVALAVWCGFALSRNAP